MWKTFNVNDELNTSTQAMVTCNKRADWLRHRPAFPIGRHAGRARPEAAKVDFNSTDALGVALARLPRRFDASLVCKQAIASL